MQGDPLAVAAALVAVADEGEVVDVRVVAHLVGDEAGDAAAPVVEHMQHDRPAAATRHLPLRAADLPRATLNQVARVLPDDEEVAANPRARSAVMRVAERTDEPWRVEAAQ